MSVRIKVVVCIHGFHFSKVINFESEVPEVGKKATIEIVSDCIWNMRCSGFMPKSEGEETDTYFFVSEDGVLFDYLCHCLGEEGWEHI